MRITVKLFAVLRDKAGVSDAIVELPPDTTVADGVEAIAAKFSGAAPLLRKAAYAVNQEYADGDRVLRDGDELALIPAVSGGLP